MSTYPHWHLYSGRPYTPAAATDVGKTFKRFSVTVPVTVKKTVQSLAVLYGGNDKHKEAA